MKAQDIFFPTEIGKVLVYKNYDKKGKEISMMKYTIMDIIVDGDKMEIKYLIESMDSKEEKKFSEEITLVKNGDILYFDMSNFINKAAFQEGGKDASSLEIEIKGNSMEIPITHSREPFTSRCKCRDGHENGLYQSEVINKYY